MATLRSLLEVNPHRLIHLVKGGVDEYQFNHINADGDAVMYDGAVFDQDAHTDWELAPASAAKDALEAAKEAKAQEVEATYQGLISNFSSGYTNEEMLSWHIQEAEAEAFKADNNANVPYMENLSNQRGKSKAEMSLRIRKKAAAYRYGSSILIGERQRCEELISLATTVAEVEAADFTLAPTFWADVQAVADAITS